MPAQPIAPAQRPAPRVPTVWTRRLQLLLLVVAGWGLLSALISAALLPSEWGRLEAAVVAQWQAEGIPASAVSMYRGYLGGVLVGIMVFTILWSLGVCALQVAGTLRRWVWWYWVQFAICCLAALGLLVTVLDVAVLAVPASAGVSPALATYRAEAAALPLTLAGDLLNVAAGVCMLIAAIRIGPWAMARDSGWFGPP